MVLSITHIFLGVLTSKQSLALISAAMNVILICEWNGLIKYAYVVRRTAASLPYSYYFALFAKDKARIGSRRRVYIKSDLIGESSPFHILLMTLM